jgi:hypothetical protein
MKKSIVAVALAAVAGAGVWFYTHEANAQDTSMTKAAQKALFAKGSDSKAERKAGKQEGPPIFRAAESVTGLSAEQKAKLDELKNAYTAKMKDMRKSEKPDAASADKKEARKAMRGKMQGINDETKTQIETVLNDAQKKEFESKLEEQKQQMKDKKTSGTAS